MRSSTSLQDTPATRPLDSETQAMLRSFLGPILETASSWRDLSARLGQKGFGLAFRDGRLMITNERGEALCTGRALGVPLSALAQRLGRPRLKADPSGRRGVLSDQG